MKIEKQAQYWDKTWSGRIKPNGNISMNGGKLQVVVKELWRRLEFIGREKLEIGCGTGIHAQHMAGLYPCWRTMWTGIDLSETAIERAKSFNLNAEVADIYTYKSDKKFQVFLLLDSLEHLEHYDLLAKQIKELSEKPYTIFGNVPMYATTIHKEGGFERPLDIHVITEFLIDAGCARPIKHNIYGVDGYPYMIFQALSTD